MNSHPIKELYEFTPSFETGSSDRPNALTAKGSLNGAEFIDMRLSTQRSRVGIIFDIRELTFEGSNTDSALPQHVPEDKTIAEYTLTRMGLSDSLTVSAHNAELYVGHVERMDGPRPGMCDESDASVIVGFPQWSSVMVVREHYSYPEP
jgi:hypothetical protein